MCVPAKCTTRVLGNVLYEGIVLCIAISFTLNPSLQFSAGMTKEEDQHRSFALFYFDFVLVRPIV